MKRSNANNVDKRPFCGVCQKAGKPESVFRGHYTKSKPGPDGVVICPTILSIECRFCHEKGHSASEDHCPALREKKLRRERWEREDRECLREKKEENKNIVLKKSAMNNRFAQAFGDSDDDNEVEVNHSKISVPLPTVVPKPVAESVRKFSYASMVKRETLIEKPIVPQYTNFTPLTKFVPQMLVKEFDLEVEEEPKQIVVEPIAKVATTKVATTKVTTTKLEILKEYYKPIPLEVEEDDDDEFSFDVNFMSKSYVPNDAW